MSFYTCGLISRVSAILLLALSASMGFHLHAGASPIDDPANAAAHEQTATTRRVMVRVTVTCEGKPVAEVPFTVQHDRAFGQGVTDSDGRTVLEIDVAASARMVALYPRPWPSSGGRTLNIEESREQYFRLIAPYTFANWYRVELRPNEGSYELSIEVARARKATLHVEPPEHPGWGAMAVSRSSPFKLNMPDADGRIIVAGLPKAKPSVIYVISSRFEGRVARVAVPAGKADVDLGKVTIKPDADASCEAKVIFHPSSTRLWRPGSAVAGVTLVSLDGERVYIFSLRRQMTESGYAPSDSVMVSAPSGEYYVVGEMFAATLAQTSVIERARAGENLRKLGVPTITVSPDQVAELELNQWEVEKIILGGEDNTDRPEYVPPKP